VLRRRRGGPDIAARVRSLQAALQVGGDCLDPQAVAQARAVLARVGERMTLGADKTVVALAGATGSGKSSLFNALAGMEIAEVGARRPTTDTAMACVWSEDGADPLLDWLDVPRRLRMSQESVLDAHRQASLRGLVLLDLPDHDSTKPAHRLEVDRLVEMVDLLVWVVDPQKYADEALHSGYLRRLAGHESVMLVVLNQIDRLAPAEVEMCRTDLRRLLDADGVDSVSLLTTSATRGDGVEKLRAVLGEVVKHRAVAIERAAADLDATGEALEAGVGETEATAAELGADDELVKALSRAAGVPAVLDAVAADYGRRAARRVGWPFTRWANRLLPDPLKRLRLGPVEEDVRRLARSALPAATPAQRSGVELAVHEVTTKAAQTLPPRWAQAVRAAADNPESDLTDALGTAVMSVDLESSEPSWWWGMAALQLLFAGAAVIGFAWLAVLGVAGWLGVHVADPPRLGSVPVPTVLLLVGVVAGLVLAGAGRWLTGLAARRRRRRVAGRVRAAIAWQAQSRVLQPVLEVLDRHRVVREHVRGER